MPIKTMRFALESDTEEILKIYTPYIKETVITFEFEVPSVDEFRKRLKEIATDYPYIVCLADGKIIGYAYAHRHMERAAYQWNAELSVYVERTCLRCGVGKALYGALIEILKLQNIGNVYGCVTFPNENSEKLHQYFGFNRVGIFHSTGYKDGAWRDVAWYEKTIGNKELEPKPLVSIQEIDQNSVKEILNHYAEQLYSR